MKSETEDVEFSYSWTNKIQVKSWRHIKILPYIMYNIRKWKVKHELNQSMACIIWRLLGHDGWHLFLSDPGGHHIRNVVLATPESLTKKYCNHQN